MRFLRHFRASSKGDEQRLPEDLEQVALTQNINFPLNPTSPFTEDLLTHLLSFLVASSQNRPNNPDEDSEASGSCGFCETNDVVQSAIVCRQWYLASRIVLYRNARINSLHYCEREAKLKHRRNSSSRIQRQEDLVRERLGLFARTVQESQKLAQLVVTLRIPYMSREYCKAELTRAVHYLSSLQYVDLPNSVFQSAQSSVVLRHELQGSCQDLRWMRFAHGAEDALLALRKGSVWPNLEEIQLHSLALDNFSLINALTALGNLRTVALSGMEDLDDDFLARLDLPFLRNLRMVDIPVTEIGILSRTSITHLNLTNTKMDTAALYRVLECFKALDSLQVSASVRRPFPLANVPKLSSTSLRSFEFIIETVSGRPNQGRSLTQSYYDYLADSILADGLPNLLHLYALSPSLPTVLLEKALKLPAIPRRQTDLCLYTKSMIEMEWQLDVITSSDIGVTTDRATRPLSLYNLAPSSPHVQAMRPKSAVVGNGFGGFLAVPDREVQPPSPARKSPRRAKAGDDWMG